MLLLRVDEYCLDVADAADSWLDSVASDEIIQSRISKLATIHVYEPGTSVLIDRDLNVVLHKPKES